MKNLKKSMKNLLWLICVLSLSCSCKQTQLASDFNKRSNKIYTKTPLKYKDFDVISKEKKAQVPAKTQKAIVNTVEKQLYYFKKPKKDKLFSDIDREDIKEVSLAKSIQQKSIKVDSILKLNLKSKSNEADILELSKKAKNFSLFGLITEILSFGIPEFVYNLHGYWFWYSLLGESIIFFFFISGIFLMGVGLLYLLKIKKVRKRLLNSKNNSKDKIESNILISYIISLVVLFPVLGFSLVALWWALFF